MKFDVIIGNPPYNACTTNSKATGKTIYGDFVKAALQFVKPNGYICFVHPSGWRKPDSRMQLWEKLKELHFVRLEIYDSKTGKETFGAGTRYDWYVLQNTPLNGPTIIKDESGAEQELNFKDWPWLPNSEFDTIRCLLAVEGVERCPVICDSSYHSARKDICSKQKGGAFVHPVLHAHVPKGTRWFWSNTKSRGHFGIPKVIFGDSGIHDPLIDMKGEWGLTEHAIGIKVDSLEEAEMIKAALVSKSFGRVLNATKWSNFQIDWRMFKYFKRDWYLQFQDN